MFLCRAGGAAPTHVLRVQQKTIAKRCNHVTRAGDFPCGAGGRDFCAKHRVCKCRCGRRVSLHKAANRRIPCSFRFSSKRKFCLCDCYPMRCKRSVSGWRRRRHSDAAHSIRSANAAENRFLLPARFEWCAGHRAFLRVARSGRKSLGSGLPFLAGGRRRIAYHRFYGRTPERRRNGSRKGLARWHELERRTRVSDRQ